MLEGHSRYDIYSGDIWTPPELKQIMVLEGWLSNGQLYLCVVVICDGLPEYTAFSIQLAFLSKIYDFDDLEVFK